MTAQRIASGVTAQQLARHALEVSTTERPEPPADSITYWCGASIYVHKSEWRVACQKAKRPTSHCACNQAALPLEREEAA